MVVRENDETRDATDGLRWLCAVLDAREVENEAWEFARTFLAAGIASFAALAGNMGFLKLGVANMTVFDGPVLHDEGSILGICFCGFGVFDGMTGLDTRDGAVQMLLPLEFG